MNRLTNWVLPLFLLVLHQLHLYDRAGSDPDRHHIGHRRKHPAGLRAEPGSDQQGAVLPTDYVVTLKPIVQRQVALAGYRLADELIADLRK